MASYYGVIQFQYEVVKANSLTEAEDVINNALDRLGDLSLDNFNWDGVDWSIREGDSEDE